MTTFKALLSSRLARPGRRDALPIVVPVLAILAFSASAASAETLRPWWHLTSGSNPSYLPSAKGGVAGEGDIVVFAENLGDAGIEGASAPVRITDILPAHVRAVEVVANKIETGSFNEVEWLPCSAPEDAGGRVSCELTAADPRPLEPYEAIELRIKVHVEEGAVLRKPGEANCEKNEVSISGGGAAPAHLTRPITVDGEPTPFGVEDYELINEDAGGAADTQAGSHPYQQTTVIDENQLADLHPLEAEESPEYRQRPKVYPAGAAKDINIKWPPGLIGNPTPVARCTTAQFITASPNTEINECPAASTVGIASVTVEEDAHIGYSTFTVPLFNLEPEDGEPARFGFYIGAGAGIPVYIDPSLRSGSDYGITVAGDNTTQKASFLSVRVTVWGVPGAPEHAAFRGWGCLYETTGVVTRPACDRSPEEHPPAFLSLPTSCNGPSLSTIEGNSWTQADNREKEGLPPLLEQLASYEMPALDGCDALPFVPEIKVSPDGQQASKPTGLTVDVHVPQEGQLNGEGLAQSNVKSITVKLPAGVAINPSSGDGLEACTGDPSDLALGQIGSPGDQIGFKGFEELNSSFEPGNQTAIFTSYLPGSIASLAAGEHSILEPGTNFCSNGSKIAEATITTPLLPKGQQVKGFVYLASQESNPFGSVLAMYIVAEDPVSGSLVKLPGEVQLCQAAGEVIAGMTCEATGQIVSTFENDPQLAFEDAEIHFFGGERAPLATPSHCGTYTTEASFTPWSGEAAVHSSSSFNITSGPNGAPCPGSELPFSPALRGAALNINAGAFSPFTATMTRLSGEQNLQSLEVHLPPGLLAILKGVELCPEPQANEGKCGPNSLIGETTVAVGVGGEPFTVSGGKFYLTGPYNGSGACTPGPTAPGCAPFGITFEVPAKAGPFDFAKTARNHPACDCVLVRGKIEVNQLTAAVTITSNPPGTADSIPTILEGIPLEIQHVNAITTRSGFQFNPTSCNKMEFTGTIHSSEGAADTIGVPFQVTNCAALKFEPKLAVSTSAKTSKADGASLSFKFTNPSVPPGIDANYAKFKVELPEQLPSRLTTLQKACTAKQFDENPAGCPAPSVVGHMRVLTPVLPVPLEGPMYFVSNGGEAFPNLIVVLQGYGVTAHLVGDTFISKAGVTSSTFKAIPDFPFTTAEVTLPQGPYSALAANGNLCAETTTKLVRKKVTVKIKGRKRTETRKVKETVPTSLAMPTEFVAQNGLKVNTTVPIGVTGCPKKAVHKAKKKHGMGKKKGRS